jgi:hypothetical protein
MRPLLLGGISVVTGKVCREEDWRVVVAWMIVQGQEE